jgi:DNA-binding IclR family transcriptional regulator
VIERAQAPSFSGGTALATYEVDEGHLSRIETGSAMRIGEIRQASAGQSGAIGGQPVPASKTSEGRALVALAPPAPPRELVARHREAPFLAQLLAVKDQHPQTRARRRAAPNEAIAAYRAAAGLNGR